MTTDEIFNLIDLNKLYFMWLDKRTTDSERIDIASTIDRIEAHRAEKAKEAFNPNEQPIIKNDNYNDILER